MNKTVFVFFLLSITLLFAPSVVLGQTEVGIESEVEVGVKAGTETKSGSESSAKAEGEIKTETKAEAKTESETKSSETPKQSETESSSSSETKSQTMGTIGVTTRGSIQATIGLPDKYPMPSVSAKSSVALQTDQHLYKPGDRVSVEGSLWTELLAGLSNSDVVTIKVFDKTKTVIYDADTQITADGNYSTEFVLPDDASRGSYTITSNVQLDGDVPDLVGVGAKTSIGASSKIVVVPPQVFKINVENHGDFDVKVTTNSTVNSVNFDGEQKKVSVTVEGESGTKGVSHISIPKDMVSGELMVMIDGKAVANDQVIVTSHTDAETEVEVNYGHSVHTIDVIGTQAVPEFGTIAMMILAVAIISIVVVTARSNLSVVPRI